MHTIFCLQYDRELSKRKIKSKVWDVFMVTMKIDILDTLNIQENDQTIEYFTTMKYLIDDDSFHFP